jgi:secondary thiamine-phosphate synthase enzyme
MNSHTAYKTFQTQKPQEIIHITPWVLDELEESGIKEGFCLVSAMHITASVFVNDNESGLHQDILDWLEGDLAPWKSHPGRGDDYLHNRTGEDNGAAHLRNLTMGHEVVIPITAGHLDLGPWQRVFYGEWDGLRPKRVVVKIIGE